MPPTRVLADGADLEYFISSVENLLVYAVNENDKNLVRGFAAPSIADLLVDEFINNKVTLKLKSYEITAQSLQDDNTYLAEVQVTYEEKIGQSVSERVHKQKLTVSPGNQYKIDKFEWL